MAVRANIDNTLTGARVSHFRRDLEQRVEHEEALMHPRMGDDKVRLVHDLIAEQNKVEIYRLGRFRRSSFSAELTFNMLKQGEELSNCTRRFNFRHPIEEIRSTWRAINGFRFDNSRNFHARNALRASKLFER